MVYEQYFSAKIQIQRVVIETGYLSNVLPGNRNEETLIVYKNRLVLLEGGPSAAIKGLHPPVG